MTNKACFEQGFDNFWRFVERCERDVRQNEHLGRMPPICFGDPWNDDFASAYKEVSRLLKKRMRYHRVPAGLCFVTGPLKSETAHQALMFFLNPPDQLYGEPSVLDSAEYKAIKNAAMAELQQRDAARHPRNQRHGCSISAKKRSEIIELRALLLDHHFPNDKPFQQNTLTSEEIEHKLGWSQSKVSRRMRDLFKGQLGMAAYRGIFSTDSTPEGFYKRLDDSTLSIDGLWLDRKSNDEDEDNDRSVGVQRPLVNNA